MWISGIRLIALLVAASAALVPFSHSGTQDLGDHPASAAHRRESPEKGQQKSNEDRERPLKQIFVKAYPIRDITGYQERLRLEQTANSSGRSDGERLEALKALQELEESGAVARSTEEVEELIRRMMNPPFNAQAQHLFAGEGRELLVSGNRMQHNSVRLLLRELRSEDRFVKLVVQVYELPPTELPASLLQPRGASGLDLRRSYYSWLQQRVLAMAEPTYERTVAGEIGRPIRLGLTRRLPIVTDYRKRTLLDSQEAIFEPIVEEIVEGPVIEALIGRFQSVQLVVEATIDHRSCRRPIPSRTIRMASGSDVVVQVPEIHEVTGRSVIHTGVNGPGIDLATVRPVPAEPRTDYFVRLRVRQ
ncbi:MAG: hypothetical protein AAGG01_03750 [Planctomycetota bacterium]